MASRLIRTLVPLAAVALALTACTSETAQQPEGGPYTLRVNWGSFPESWAPGAQLEPGTFRIPYETLVKRTADGQIQPNLATEWEYVTPTSLALTLRDDVTFHDGTDFNAEAVKVNIEYVKAAGGQFGGPLQVVDTIEVVDATHVTINFKRPAPTFLAVLSQRNVPMASPTAIEAETIAAAPVGTGPWAYDEAASIDGTKMTFSKFDDYWGEFPAFDNIELYAIPDDTAATAALIGGEIDITDTELDEFPRLDSAANADHLSYPAIRNNVVFFDRGPGGVFADVRVRQALCYALDPQVVVDIDEGQVQTQHFIEGEVGYNPEIEGYSHNLDLATELLAEAGNPTINATFPAAPFNRAQVTVYAEQMNELPGVNITVQELPVPQFISTWNSGQFALGVGSHGQITPQDWYNSWFSATAGGNPAGVQSAELGAAAQAAVAASGTPEAEELWGAVMQEISDEALACGHMMIQELIAWNTDTVSNVAAPTEVWEQNAVNYRALTPA